MRSLIAFIVLITLANLGVFAKPASGSPHSKPITEKITVGFEMKIPFVIQDDKGELEGLAVDLWEQIADKNKIDYELIPLAPGEGVRALQEGRMRVAFLSDPVNLADERRIDYTVPFYTEGYAIALKNKMLTPSLWQTIHLVFSTHFLDVFLYLIIIFAIAGTMIWAAERKRNTHEFHRPALRGIGDGIWWAVVTITTIGYGDKVAKTHLGRVISTFWIIFGLLLTSIITAAFASTVTLNAVKFDIRSIDNLRGLKTGVIAGSHEEAVLKNRKIVCRPYKTYAEALKALDQKKLDTVFAGQAALIYEIKDLDLDEVVVSLVGENRSRYAFAVRNRDVFLEDLNLSLMEIIDGLTWEDIELKYGL
ncbi:transporter substrate-binding domain-containing protein [Kamptonema cortianum]|nr:transporter substrate-binding domain-containing protein [Kamptonema cortianum]MDL5055527.1 transporter substrate-binding domain-containing protein [Oscillatoria laete-virens NRMC-F 0139]